MTAPWTIAAWSIAACGAAVIAWGLFADRARGRRRCPRCWYELVGASTAAAATTCPECGFTSSRERSLRRTRRHLRAALAGCFVMAAGYGVGVASAVRVHGWFAAIPNTAMVVWAAFSDDERMPAPGTPREALQVEVWRRVGAREFSGWQLRALLWAATWGDPIERIVARPAWPAGVPIVIGVEPGGVRPDAWAREFVPGTLVRSANPGTPGYMRMLGSTWTPRVVAYIDTAPPPADSTAIDIDIEVVTPAMRHLESVWTERTRIEIVPADTIIGIDGDGPARWLRRTTWKVSTDAIAIESVDPGSFAAPNEPGGSMAFGFRVELLRDGLLVATGESEAPPWASIDLHWCDPAAMAMGPAPRIGLPDTIEWVDETGRLMVSERAGDWQLRLIGDLRAALVAELFRRQTGTPWATHWWAGEVEIQLTRSDLAHDEVIAVAIGDDP